MLNLCAISGSMRSLSDGEVDDNDLVRRADDLKTFMTGGIGRAFANRSREGDQMRFRIDHAGSERHLNELKIIIYRKQRQRSCRRLPTVR
jgi:hypothetical protein